MNKISKGLSTFGKVAKLAKYVPFIGPGVTLVQKTITVLKVPFMAGFKQVSRIVKKLGPLQEKIDRIAGDYHKGNLTYPLTFAVAAESHDKIISKL